MQPACDENRALGADVFSAALAGGVSKVSFSQLSANLGRTMYEFKFRIPAYYTLLVRSLSVLEARAPCSRALSVLLALCNVSEPSTALQDIHFSCFSALVPEQDIGWVSAAAVQPREGLAIDEAAPALSGVALLADTRGEALAAA